MEERRNHTDDFKQEWLSLTGETITDEQARDMMFQLATLFRTLHEVYRGLEEQKTTVALATSAKTARMAGLSDRGGSDEDDA